MADSLQLIIKSAFDATGITAASNSINRIDSQISRATRAMQKFSGLLAGGTAGAAVLGFLNSAVNEFAKEEREVLKLNRALQNLGITDKAVSADLVKFSESMSYVTKATQEEIIATATSLTQRGLYGAELKKAIATSLDLATKTGNLASASEIVGKAYQGVTKGLNTIGVQLDANIPKTEVYAETMRQLNTMFGGAAQAEMQGYAGRVEALGKRFDDLKERLGGVLITPANWAIAWLEDFSDVMNMLGDKISGHKDKLTEATKEFKAAYAHFKDVTGEKQWWEAQSTQHEIDRAAQRLKWAREDLRKVMDASKPGAGGKATPNRETGARPEQDKEWIKAQDDFIKDIEKQGQILTEADDFWLSERGKLYSRFFGDTKRSSHQALLSQVKDAEDMKDKNKNFMRTMERDYEAASKTFSGGFKQALLETESGLWNFRDGFNSAINSAVGPAQQALKDFFNMSSSGFGNIGRLAEKTFKGILNAFYDMITQMIAKYMVFKMVTGMGLGGTAFGRFLGLATGGPVPGPKGSPVPIIAHGGEFMLSANVVDAIKAGRQTSNLSMGASGGSRADGNSGAVIHQNITVSGVGSGNVREICRQIADAGRKGVTEALDAAKVLYKQGARRAGEAAL